MTIDPTFQPLEPDAGPVDQIRQAGEHMSQAAGAAADAFVPPTVRRHMRAAMRHLFAAGVAAMDTLESRAQYYEQRRASPPPPVTPTPVTPGPSTMAAGAAETF